MFDVVRERFHKDGRLSAFDFFCIVIWKANRAKSKVANRILKHAGGTNLEQAVEKLTVAIAKQPSAEERLRLLLDSNGGWGLRLPMATAILSVLYPEEFTIFDVRVKEQLKSRDLANCRLDQLWPEYQAFKQLVESNTPPSLSLRKKDRYLWGKSFHDQLRQDIKGNFPRSKKSGP